MLITREVGLASVILAIGCATAPPPADAPTTTLESVSYSVSDDRCSRGHIVITGTRCTSIGVRAEHAWLAQKYPGYEVVHHALAPSVVGSPCDTVTSDFTLVLPSGETANVAFEISSFYGRWEGCPK